jgi:hypothetical protein
MDTIPIVPTKEYVFSLDDIEFRVKRLVNGKVRTLKATKLKFLKLEGKSLSLTYTISSI